VSARGFTFLFFPYSHGVGFGYIGRQLTIAADLRDAGHRCVFACDTRENLVARCGFEVRAASGAHGVAVPDMGRRRGDYVAIDNLDTAFAIAGYYHADRVRADVRADLEVIRAVRPDAVVVDMQPTAALAARHLAMPCVSVGDSDFFRPTDNSWMPWLSGEALVSPYPSCLPAFNTVGQELNVAGFRGVSEVLLGDLTLVASVPELESNQEPLPQSETVSFVGPIAWDPPWSTVEGDLAGHGQGQRRIYVTLGHGGKATTRQLMPILSAASSVGVAVFVSLGFRHHEELPNLPSNVRAGDFTGISAPVRWADAVISHGGYSTVLTSLQYGRPQIVLPLMSEQEANGRLFVEDNDAGFLLRRTERAHDGPRHFRHHLRYTGASDDGHCDAAEWVRAINEILDDSRYRKSAERVGSTIRDYVDGRSFAAIFGRFLARRHSEGNFMT
jgi:UDP:flavonoid glycosyltransferase YjiC (YdhE family)